MLLSGPTKFDTMELFECYLFTETITLLGLIFAGINFRGFRQYIIFAGIKRPYSRLRLKIDNINRST